jgi:hypothetical protein
LNQFGSNHFINDDYLNYIWVVDREDAVQAVAAVEAVALEAVIN